jgi:hypothetical protein
MQSDLPPSLIPHSSLRRFGAHSWESDRHDYGLGDGGEGSISEALELALYLGLGSDWRIATDIGSDPVVHFDYVAKDNVLTVEVGAMDEDVSVLEETEMKFVFRDVRPADLAADGPVARWAELALHAVTEVHESGEALFAERETP